MDLKKIKSNEEKVRYSIYICPEKDCSSTNNSSWNKGLGEVLSEINYFKNIWSLPHFTLTKFSEYINVVNNISDNKIALEISQNNEPIYINVDNNCMRIFEAKAIKDIDDIASFVSKNFLGEKFFDFRECKVMKSNNLYILAFEKVELFDLVKNKLKSHGYNVKDNKPHLTLGYIKEINEDIKFENIKTGIKLSLKNNELSENFFSYFSNLEFCLSIVRLQGEKFPVEIIYQNKLKLNE